MYDIDDSRILDKNAEFFNVNMENLMENAGRAVANEVLNYKPKRVLALCGSGNNGGDGYVAARELKLRGIDVHVFPVQPPSSELCIKKYKESIDSGVQVDSELSLNEYELIIDAMLGIGIKNEPKEPYKSVIQKVNESNKFVISVDVPSGFPSKIRIKPTITVTMQFLKKGMDENCCGKIIVVDVGFPKEVIESVGPGELILYKMNERESHKGMNGIVMVVAGSIHYYGAPIYVSKSAARMGVDLVYLFSPKSIHSILGSNFHDMILRNGGNEFIELTHEMKDMLKERNVTLAIGPGISKNEDVLNTVREIVNFAIENKRKVVVDADALSAIKDINFKNLGVLTPHRGEFKEIFGEEPNEENVKNRASKLNVTILVKGSIDIITDGDRIKKNKVFHHASMTRGGTGDVLTGVIAGLMARNIDPYHAACMGSFIVGSAGLAAFEKYSNFYYTSELIDLIPEVMKKYVKNE
ncbi:MAG: NAD(P)H-hydrate dehydratase [Thermoplasmata archaeon]